jgi:hypothetical protein
MNFDLKTRKAIVEEVKKIADETYNYYGEEENYKTVRLILMKKKNGIDLIEGILEFTIADCYIKSGDFAAHVRNHLMNCTEVDYYKLEKVAYCALGTWW